MKSLVLFVISSFLSLSVAACCCEDDPCGGRGVIPDTDVCRCETDADCETGEVCGALDLPGAPRGCGPGSIVAPPSRQA